MAIVHRAVVSADLVIEPYISSIRSNQKMRRRQIDAICRCIGLLLMATILYNCCKSYTQPVLIIVRFEGYNLNPGDSIRVSFFADSIPISSTKYPFFQANIPVDNAKMITFSVDKYDQYRSVTLSKPGLALADTLKNMNITDGPDTPRCGHSGQYIGSFDYRGIHYGPSERIDLVSGP